MPISRSVASCSSVSTPAAMTRATVASQNWTMPRTVAWRTGSLSTSATGDAASFT
jgi:hypothetical protein